MFRSLIISLLIVFDISELSSKRFFIAVFMPVSGSNQQKNRDQTQYTDVTGETSNASEENTSPVLDKKPLSELSQKDKNLTEAGRENFTDPQLNHTKSHGSDEEPLSETSAESEADYLKPRETNPVTSPTPGNQISDAENALKISATPYYPAHHTKKIFDTSVLV